MKDVVTTILAILGIIYFVGVSTIAYRHFESATDKGLKELLAGHIVADWAIVIVLIAKIL